MPEPAVQLNGLQRLSKKSNLEPQNSVETYPLLQIPSLVLPFFFSGYDVDPLLKKEV